jgi:signal transduction histidine kinase
MFPAELTAVLSNLLTNAVKAAGQGGRIRATGEVQDGQVVLRVENTGSAVSPSEGERWFRPFESSTVNVDPVLGQGMGLGLPITRALLEDYRAEIRFVEPRRGFATSVEIVF